MKPFHSSADAPTRVPAEAGPTRHTQPHGPAPQSSLTGGRESDGAAIAESIAPAAPSRHSFSVGVDDMTDNKRRAIMDGIAILAGRENRLGNHVLCFERMIDVLYEVMVTMPDLFAQWYGEGDADSARKFQAFAKRQVTK